MVTLTASESEDHDEMKSEDNEENRLKGSHALIVYIISHTYYILVDSIS